MADNLKNGLGLPISIPSASGGRDEAWVPHSTGPRAQWTLSTAPTQTLHQQHPYYQRAKVLPPAPLRMAWLQVTCSPGEGNGSYQDVCVLGVPPCGQAGAVAEFKCPVLLGSYKKVPGQ